MRESSQGLPEQILAEVHFQIQPGPFERDIPQVGAAAALAVLPQQLRLAPLGLTEAPGYSWLGVARAGRGPGAGGLTLLCHA
jgi:hypothetical protein